MPLCSQGWLSGVSSSPVMMRASGSAGSCSPLLSRRRCEPGRSARARLSVVVGDSKGSDSVGVGMAAADVLASRSSTVEE